MPLENDIESLLNILPTNLVDLLPTTENLIELVFDLGRMPEVRYFDGSKIFLTEDVITQDQLDTVTKDMPEFTSENRSGVDKTLHRISCLRNRKKQIIGLTVRVGRSIPNAAKIIEDVLQSGKSILLVGAPGTGKSTLLRSAASILAESKRVMVVDTSNELGGEGNVIHSALGNSRRIQVINPNLQWKTMTEAVENHTPEVIVIDEISTSQETMSARTIAERGVQLIGTAHGKTLENLIKNPTLNDLLGSLATVTLGDEESARRGCQKTVLEREKDPTFDIVIEILDIHSLAIHFYVAAAVDSYLRGGVLKPEIRTLNEDGSITVSQRYTQPTVEKTQVFKFEEKQSIKPLQNLVYSGTINLYTYNINKEQFNHAAQVKGLRIKFVKEVGEADAVIISKRSSAKNPPCVDIAKTLKKKVYFLHQNTYVAVEKLLKDNF